MDQQAPARTRRLVDLTDEEFEAFVSELPVGDELVEDMRRVRDGQHRRRAVLNPMVRMLYPETR